MGTAHRATRRGPRICGGPCPPYKICQTALSLIHLTSLDDPRLETFRHLKDTNRTRWMGRFIAEGEKLVRRLLASDFPVESVLLSERFVPQWESLLPAGLPVLVVPDALGRAAGRFQLPSWHFGVRPAKTADLAGGMCCRSKRPSRWSFAPRCKTPKTSGSILRLAAAFDIEGVLVGRGAADPFSRRVLRVSMGAALRVPVIESQDIAAVLRQLAGPLAMQLVATVLDPAAEPLATPRGQNVWRCCWEARATDCGLSGSPPAAAADHDSDARRSRFAERGRRRRDSSVPLLLRFPGAGGC